MSNAVHEVPCSAVCGLQNLKFALQQIKALQAGQPPISSPEHDVLPKELPALMAFAMALADEIHGEVQAAFDELDRINYDETNHVACLLDEIL